MRPSNNNSRAESSRSARERENQQREYNARNAAAETFLAAMIRDEAEESRASNTNKAYFPKQMLFKNWCQENNYEDCFVDEGKIVRFLQHIREKGYHTKSIGEDGSIMETRKSYSYESIKQFTKALVDLHSKQISENKGRLVLPHPRGPTLKSFEQTIKKECHNNVANEYEDPAVGSIQDGYTTEQMVKIANYYFKIEKGIHNALRDRMVFLMNHMMMLRGETLRSANLNHLFSLEFKNEGIQRCPAFVMMVLSGKTNQENMKLYSAVIRHKNVFTCAFGAIGFYLFFRFHIYGEPFPNFSQNELWFDTKLARGQKSDKSVCYQTQLNSIDRAFEANGINSKKKTHASRQAGARDAEMAGLSHDHIRRVGRWNNDSLQNNYLDCLPRTAIRAMQGFSEKQGRFWLERNLVAPPESLQKQIFPEVEHWQQEMKDNERMRTICGEGFLNLLLELRIIILQDAVEMREAFPNHEIFKHSIFKSAEFNNFAESLKLAIATTPRPAELRILDAMPDVHEQLAQLNQQMNVMAAQQQSASNASINNESLVDQIVDKLLYRLKENSDGVSMRPSTSRVRRRSVVEQNEDMIYNAPPSKIYRLNRDLITVLSVWQEWTVGLEDHLPSVRDLDAQYGKSWRRNDRSEAKYYSNRLKIVNEIERIAKDECLSQEEATQKLEDERTQGGYSLDKLQKIISSRNKSNDNI